MTGTYKIADRIILVNSVYEKVHDYCSAYRCAGKPDITVVITPQDIDRERARNARTCMLKGRSSFNSAEDYLEELAVYRIIAEKMPAFDTFLFHGSCVAVDGQGYLFTANSGTGKSTHAGLWRSCLGERAVMVNDDKPLIRADKTGVTVFGTPYNGKHRRGTNISVPLKAVCILSRSAENHIEPASKEQVYTTLLQQVYRPADGAAMTKTLALLDIMAEKVKLYRLGCNMDIEAAKVAYEGMV